MTNDPKKPWCIILGKIVGSLLLRLFSAIPLIWALITGKFEVLATVSFILALVGPWEIITLIKERGIEGFGVKILGNIVQERKDYDAVIKTQKESIDVLKGQLR